MSRYPVFPLGPDAFSGPRAFARWMLADARLPLVNVAQPMRQFRNLCMEALLFRDGCWQVELVVLFPGVVVPRHRHLLADSVELGIAGSLEAEIGGVAVKRARRGSLFANLVPVPSCVWHGGRAGPDGATWLSFQRWNNGEARFLTDDWEE